MHDTCYPIGVHIVRLTGRAHSAKAVWWPVVQVVAALLRMKKSVAKFKCVCSVGLPSGEAALVGVALLMRHCMCEQTALACVRRRLPLLDSLQQPTWRTAKHCRLG